MRPTLAALLFYLAAVETSFGCSCGPMSAPQKFARSSVVFIGRVVSLREQGQERHYEFQVVDVLKGVRTEKLVVKSSGSGGECGSFFEKGPTYLVYADGATDRLSTNLCKGNRDTGSAEGKAEIETLRDRK